MHIPKVTILGPILSAATASAVNGRWLPSRKTLLRSVSVELELVPIQLVSDTDIEATANQRWTLDGLLAASRGFRLVIASQWQLSPSSSSFRMRLKLLGRVNTMPILLAVDSRHPIDRQNWPCKRAISSTSVSGRSQLSTCMYSYRAYGGGRGARGQRTNF